MRPFFARALQKLRRKRRIGERTTSQISSGKPSAWETQPRGGIRQLYSQVAKATARGRRTALSQADNIALSAIEKQRGREITPEEANLILTTRQSEARLKDPPRPVKDIIG